MTIGQLFKLKSVYYMYESPDDDAHSPLLFIRLFILTPAAIIEYPINFNRKQNTDIFLPSRNNKC
jgi:hypothetical protein